MLAEAVRVQELTQGYARTFRIIKELQRLVIEPQDFQRY